MSGLRAAAGWLLRTALLFVALVATLWGLDRWQRDAGAAAGLAERAVRLERASVAAQAEIAGLEGRAVTALAQAERQSVAAIDRRRAAIAAERRRLAGRRPDFLSAPEDQLTAWARARIADERLAQEDAFLREARDIAAHRDHAARLDAEIARLQHQIARDRADAAAARVAPPWRRYSGFTDLAAFYTERAERNRAALQRKTGERRAYRDLRVPETPTVAVDRLRTVIAPLEAASRASAAAAAANLVTGAQRLGITRQLRPAALWLLAILLSPLLVRSLAWWVLAPLAARQGVVRLLGPGATVPFPAPSQVTVAVPLTEADELLIRPAALRTTPTAAAAATLALLDWRHPLTSLAARLALLIRLRVPAPATVTVAAAADPLAETALLQLPEGARMALRARHLLGVVQPRGRPLRITAHWRLYRLQAWLTGQLRLLVFHGPATLIVHGGRGIRAAPATQGVRLAGERLVGFSTGLALSTARSETFLPYLLGQQPLLKDSVVAGEGIVLTEEMGVATGHGAPIRHRVEGGLDILLKLFGF